LFSSLSEEQIAKLVLLGQLTSGIAHEINNPLHQISLQAELLQMWADKGNLSQDKVHSAANSIIQTVDRIAKIIKNVKSLMGEYNHESPTQINANKWLTEAVSWVQDTLSYKNIKLQIHIIEQEAFFSGRPFQLIQILLNLISNAVEAISVLPEVDKWIKIQILELSETIEIRVSNGGPPISDELADKIFNLYFSTKEPTQSLGIGLNISLNLALRNNAQLFLERNQPQTTFVLSLSK